MADPSRIVVGLAVVKRSGFYPYESANHFILPPEGLWDIIPLVLVPAVVVGARGVKWAFRHGPVVLKMTAPFIW